MTYKAIPAIDKRSINERFKSLWNAISGGGAAAPAYKSYVAILNQTGTDDPIPTVLENTLGGEVVWTRSGAGNFTGALAGGFPENKTFVQLTTEGYVINGGWWAGDVYINAYDGTNTMADVADLTSVEIRVYP